MNKQKRITCFTVIIACFIMIASTTIFNPTASKTDYITLTTVSRNSAQPLVYPTKTSYSLISKVSFAGSYLLNISGLPSVTVTASEARLGFKGCNTINFAYEAYNNGTFKMASTPASTQVSCSNNQDSKYLSIFSSANAFRISGSTITLLQGTKSLLTLNPSKTSSSSTGNESQIGSSTNSAVNQAVTPQVTQSQSEVLTSLSGNYIGSFQFVPATSFTFSNSTMRFEGCNSHTISYEAFDDGRFRTLEPIVSTERACADDKDQQYIYMLKMADEYVRSGTTITLTRNKVFLVTFRI